MVAFHFVFCFEEDWTKCSNFSPPATVILLILLCFEGLLFLIFTAVMFGTQVHSICTDETGIEQLKKEERRWAKKSKWMNLKVVFGHPFSIAWLSPFATPDHGKADIYQYIVWKQKNKAELCCCGHRLIDPGLPSYLAGPQWAWTPLNHFYVFFRSWIIDISGCSVINYYVVKTRLFFKTLSPFHFIVSLLGADWD